MLFLKGQVAGVDNIPSVEWRLRLFWQPRELSGDCKEGQDTLFALEEWVKRERGLTHSTSIYLGPTLQSTQLLIKPHFSEGPDIMFKHVGSRLRVPGFSLHHLLAVCLRTNCPTSQGSAYHGGGSWDLSKSTAMRCLAQCKCWRRADNFTLLHWTPRAAAQACKVKSCWMLAPGSAHFSCRDKGRGSHTLSLGPIWFQESLNFLNHRRLWHPFLG